MQFKKRKPMAEIVKKTGAVPSADLTGESAVPSANKVKGAELAVKANLASLKKKPSVSSAEKVESQEEMPTAKGPSSKYQDAIKKRLNKKK